MWSSLVSNIYFDVVVVSSYEAFVNLHVDHLRTAAEVFDANSDSDDEDLEDCLVVGRIRKCFISRHLDEALTSIVLLPHPTPWAFLR